MLVTAKDIMTVEYVLNTQLWLRLLSPYSDALTALVNSIAKVVSFMIERMQVVSQSMRGSIVHLTRSKSRYLQGIELLQTKVPAFQVRNKSISPV